MAALFQVTQEEFPFFLREEEARAFEAYLKTASGKAILNTSWAGVLTNSGGSLRPIGLDRLLAEQF